jgi:hypothetical protein
VLEQLPADRPGPAEAAADQHRRDVLESALDQLPPLQREAIGLAFLEDLTHEQVAAELGLPLGTAKTRIRTGLQKLRATLGPQGAALIAVCLLVVLGIRYWSEETTRARDDRALAMMTASDSVNLRLAPLSGMPAETHARYRGRPGVGIAVVTLSQFPAAPEGEAYQAWARHGATWTSLGTAELDQAGNARLIAESPALSTLPDGVQVTLEPRAGSASPSGPVVVEWLPERPRRSTRGAAARAPSETRGGARGSRRRSRRRRRHAAAGATAIRAARVPPRPASERRPDEMVLPVDDRKAVHLAVAHDRQRFGDGRARRAAPGLARARAPHLQLVEGPSRRVSGHADVAIGEHADDAFAIGVDDRHGTAIALPEDARGHVESLLVAAGTDVARHDRRDRRLVLPHLAERAVEEPAETGQNGHARLPELARSIREPRAGRLRTASPSTLPRIGSHVVIVAGAAVPCK